MVGMPLEKAPTESVEVDENNPRVLSELALDEVRQLVKGMAQSSRSTG